MMRRKTRGILAALATLVCALALAIGAGPVTAMAADSFTNRDTTIYGLAPATYTVYSDQALTKVAATVNIDSNGNAVGGDVELAPGDYWIVETTDGTGLGQDSEYTRANPKHVTISSGQTTSVNSTDPAKNWIIRPYKQDNQLGATAQADTSLTEGGRFRVRAWAARTYSTVAECEAAGVADVDKTVPMMTSPSDAAQVTVPFGTVLVEEVAPTGTTPADNDMGWAIYQYTGADGTKPKYAAGNQMAMGLVGSVAQPSWTTTGVTGQTVGFQTMPMGNTTFDFSITINKVDKDTSKAVPQGDASLEGATFRIYNISKGPVVVNGTIYQACAKDAHADDACVAAITTDANGVATSPLVTYGSYQIYEVNPSNGYKIVDNPSNGQVVTSHETVQLQAKSIDWDEPVSTGWLRAEKIDKHSGQAASGDLTFKGTKFKVTNASKNSIVYDGKEVKPGEDLDVTLVAGDDGLTQAIEVPCGTYTVTETVPPTGYKLPANPTSEPVEIHEQNTEATAKVVSIADEATTNPVPVRKTTQGLTSFGNLNVAGATFEVYNISAKAISVTNPQTKATRTVETSQASGTHKKSDANYIDTMTTDAKGSAVLPVELPAGTYGVIEIQAPMGCLLYSETPGYKPAKFDYDQVFTIDGKGNVSPITFDDTPKTVPLRIYKFDADLAVVDGRDQDAGTQGNATLAGATFEVVNSSDTIMFVNDGTNQNHKWRRVDPGGTIASGLTTSYHTTADGHQVADVDLPCQLQVGSTVTVRETKAPTGYLLNSTTYKVDIDADGNVTTMPESEK